MAKDNLLCIEDLDAFKKYLDHRGIAYTVRSHKTKILYVHRVTTQTHTLTKKNKESVHITVPKELFALVRDFITHRKKGG